MTSLSIEVVGPDAVEQAGDLREVLAVSAGPADVVSPVEVTRSAELVVAIIGLVFGGVDAAKTVWDWWQARRSTGVTVKILLEDGRRIDLSGIDEQKLRIELDRRPTHGDQG